MYTLEKVREITCATPETRHEEWFRDTYADVIADALTKLMSPEDPTNPANCWTAFKQVRTHTHTRARMCRRNIFVAGKSLLWTF